MLVSVRDNNVDQALRILKKKMQREGLYKEMKLRKHYEKPSLKRAREKERKRNDNEMETKTKTRTKTTNKNDASLTNKRGLFDPIELTNSNRKKKSLLTQMQHL